MPPLPWLSCHEANVAPRADFSDATVKAHCITILLGNRLLPAASSRGVEGTHMLMWRAQREHQVWMQDR